MKDSFKAKAIAFLKNNYIIISILILGALLRLVMLGTIPGNKNLNQDEVYAAYEAYSLSTFGIDSHGYHNPVYLEAWGSGMNALETYLMIPFIKVLGLNPIAVRLPQAIVACLTILFVYLLFEHLADKKVALFGTFVLAVSPWHIMLSRWGLESNLIVGFLVMAMYFLITSNHKLWRIILAGALMGLSLYCYASAWIILPFLILATVIYLIIAKQMDIKGLIIYAVTVAIFAVPLILFVLVNMGYINEINSFISIPKLGYFRNEEIGFSIDKLKYTLHILWTQDDESIWNSTSQFGIFYHFTRFLLPFGIIGLIVKRNKKSIPILMWLLISFVHSTMVDANFTRINTLFIPILFVIATGIAFIVSLFGEKLGKIAAVGVVACYLFSLTVFSRYYCTDYNKVMAEVWFDRFYDALEKASFSGGIIHVMYGDASYPLILYYSEYPVEKFVDSVVYWDESAPFLHPTSFDGYTLTDFTDEEPVSGEAYICYKGHAEALEYLQAHGMECEEFGNYVVGEMP